MARTILFTLLLAAFELSAQTKAPKNTGNLSAYSAGSKEDISRLAGKMLDRTNQARAALKDGDGQLALQDVNRAESDLKQMEARSHGATLVPVYREFVSISILTPAHARQQTANGSTVVHEVAGDYTHVLVSTAVAKRGLSAAQTALEHGETKLADAALSDVQAGVQAQSVESDIPLSRARENLILARAAARQDRYQEAQAALQAASKALTRYEMERGAHRDQAKNIQQQIDSYAGSMQQNSGSAVSKINNWWNTISGWSPYQSAETSTRTS